MNDQALAAHNRAAPENAGDDRDRLPTPRVFSRSARLLAWGVHLYTALGLVLAAAIAMLLVRGGADSFRGSFVLMVVATFIDATDGALARRFRVKEVLPGFDGRKLDDLIDFLNYTFLPMLLVWRAGVLPTGHEWWWLFPLLASAYGFCQVEAKTDDGYFLGFPSHWNAVAFYLYVLPVPEWLALGSLLFFGVLTFVPTRYLYPTQPGLINVLSLILGVVWAGMIVAILWRMPAGRHPTTEPTTTRIALASLFYPAFYMIASWVITARIWLAGRAARRSARPS